MLVIDLTKTQVTLSASEVSARLKANDEKVFEYLFKEYYQRLSYYAFNYLKDHDLSEETVQQVFCGIWQNRNQYSVEDSWASFLFRAVRNHCLNQIKHQKVKSEYQEYQRHVMSEGDTSDTVVHQELELKIFEVIEAMPPERKKVFQKSRWEGLKYKEIALELNISVKTVENQMGKALAFLRKELVEYLPTIFWIFLLIWRDEF